MATVAERKRLRAKIGETVPPSGTSSDTRFTDEQIDDILGEHEDFNAAVLDGWQRKAAIFANLVDTTEGTSRRAFSDLHVAALEQIKVWTKLTVAAQPRTRVHQISRDV